MEVKNKKFQQIPNTITLFRIGIAIIIFILGFIYVGFFYSASNLSLASYANFQELSYFELFLILWVLMGFLFVLAAFSDFVDGYIARKYSVVSTFGKFLDPIADKIVINGILIILSVLRIVPIWFTILFIVRDIFVNGMRLVLAESKTVISASIWGKLKTIFQFIGILVIFCLSPLYGVNSAILGTTGTIQYIVGSNFWFPWLINFPLVIGLAFSYFSGYIYLNKGFKKYGEIKKN